METYKSAGYRAVLVIIERKDVDADSVYSDDNIICAGHSVSIEDQPLRG